jgi:hypothetical protein
LTGAWGSCSERVAEATTGKASPEARKLRRELGMVYPPNVQDIRI